MCTLFNLTSRWFLYNYCTIEEDSTEELSREYILLLSGFENAQVFPEDL